MNSVPIFQGEHMTRRFKGLVALNDLSLTVNEGEILGIVGPNGAGKSVLINLITKFYELSSGKTRICGIDTTNLSRMQTARLGVARTFQNIRLFSDMSVLENVMVAQQEYVRQPWRSFTGIWSKKDIGKAEDLLDLMRLSDYANSAAGRLSYGAARRLEIARALATRPALLLLDEPAAGMNEEETGALVKDIARARKLTRAIVLIEHDMSLIRSLSTRLIAIVAGSQVAEGSVNTVLSDPIVVESYLGSNDF